MDYHLLPSPARYSSIPTNRRSVFGLLDIIFRIFKPIYETPLFLLLFVFATTNARSATTKKSKPPKRNSKRCSFPKDDLAEAAILAVAATMAAAPDCLANIVEGLCNSIEDAINSCTDPSDNCFCQLISLEILEYEEEQCFEQLMELVHNPFQTNLVPYPRIHFLSSYAPVIS